MIIKKFQLKLIIIRFSRIKKLFKKKGETEVQLIIRKKMAKNLFLS